MIGEPELLLAPEFFTTWAADHPSVAGLDIQVKRGAADNELNRYRYDVIVHKIPTPVRPLATAPTWAWTECAGLSGLHTTMTSHRPAAVRVTEIPRAGLVTDVHIEQALATGLPLADALAQACAAETPDTVTPEQLHRLGETTGYHVAVTWGAQPGTLDAVFITPTDPGSHTTTDRPIPAPHRGPPTHHLRQRPPDQHQDQRGASAVERAVARLHGAGADYGARGVPVNLLGQDRP